MRKPKPYDYSDPRPPSRSQKKRDSADLQVLGGKLAEMPDSALKRLALPPRLEEAIREYKAPSKHEAKRRQLQFQKSRQRMMQAVPNATVVVMNPTHYAVALRYVQGETAAPECVAKGVDTLALRIRDLAREHGVPVVEDPPLARALYATVEVDQVIPTQHFEAVAKLIGFILAKARERARPARVARGL